MKNRFIFLMWRHIRVYQVTGTSKVPVTLATTTLFNFGVNRGMSMKQTRHYNPAGRAA
jgi:hypothetical protein